MVDRIIKGFQLSNVLRGTKEGLACKFCGEQTGLGFKRREHPKDKHADLNQQILSPNKVSYKHVHKLQQALCTWAGKHRCTPEQKLVWRVEHMNDEDT